MSNGNNIMNENNKYLFLENIDELYKYQLATCTSWANKFMTGREIKQGDIIILAILNGKLNNLVFTKEDLKNIRKTYQLIRIYFGQNYVNLICDIKDNGISVLKKISDSPLINNWIIEKLDIKKYSLNQFVINNYTAITEDLMTAYKLEFKTNINDNYKNPGNKSLKPMTYNKNTIAIVDNLNNNSNNMDKTQIIYNNSNNQFMNKFNKGQNFNNNMNQINQHKLFNQPNQFNQFNQVNQNFWHNNQIILMNNQRQLNNMQINLQNLQMQNIQMQNMLNNNQNQFNNMKVNINNNSSNNISSNNNNNQNYIQNYSTETEKNANQLLQLNNLKEYQSLYFPLKGLNNVGLTCYMNSTLQCLLHIPDLSYFFINLFNEFKNSHSDIMKKTESRGLLSIEYKKVLDGVWGEEKKGIFFRDAFSPKRFNDLISKLNPQFAKYESNDARDLMIYLLQQMHEELNFFGGEKLGKIPKCNQLNEADAFNFFYQVNSTLNFSIISYLFWGIVKQTTICMKCKSLLYNFQYFQYLSFPLYSYKDGRFNFYRGLKEYTKEEILSGDNQFYCQVCNNLRDAKVESKICYTSPYLIINLDYGKGKKYNPNSIDFGSTIFITKEFLNKNIPEAQYQLVAVSTHMGSSGNAGHYIAFCKDPKDDKIWHKFNDSSHSLCKFEDTYSYSPYLLIFKKL